MVELDEKLKNARINKDMKLFYRKSIRNKTSNIEISQP